MYAGRGADTERAQPAMRRQDRPTRRGLPLDRTIRPDAVLLRRELRWTATAMLALGKVIAEPPPLVGAVQFTRTAWWPSVTVTWVGGTGFSLSRNLTVAEAAMPLSWSAFVWIATVISESFARQTRTVVSYRRPRFLDPTKGPDPDALP